MKKIFSTLCTLALILLLVNCTGKASGSKQPEKDNANIVVEIPDAIFKAYLIEHFDTNSDGELSVEEALGIKDLNVSGMGIEVLDGIEKFANLESLDCSNNQIEEVEVRYNKKLEKLVCTGNKTPLTIYIGMSSPLKKKDFQKPVGSTPQTTDLRNPIDATKAIYDEGKTNIMIMYEE